MPFVRGFLRVVRRGGRPDQGLPEVQPPVDPDYGIEEGGEEGIWPGLPGQGLPKPPQPPPGVWPPPTPDIPIQPLPPQWPGMPKPPINLPPGMIWPNPNPPSVGGGPIVPPNVPGQPLPPTPGLPPSVGGGPIEPAQKFVVLVWISGGYGWRYVVVDPSLVPTPPIAPTPEPKR